MTQNPLIARPSRPLPACIGVVGAGAIGPDIAYLFASRLPATRVVVVDIALTPLAAAEKRLAGYRQKAVDTGRMKVAEAARVGAALVFTTDYGQLAEAELVIEAATENLDVKRRIFAQLEALCAPEAVLASNTSSIPAARIFSALAVPSRATVTHFFAPAWRNPAVEVVAARACDPAVVHWLCWLFARAGKSPMVTADAICFALDRVFDNWCNEAALLLGGGATAAEIDAVAEEFVYAGPFFVLNLARGNPIITETNTLQMEEGAAYRPAAIFRSVKDWEVPPPGKGRPPADPALRQAVRDRLLGILWSQAADIVDRGIASAADVELGCALALGFKEGPFATMAREDAPRILGRLAEERPGLPGLSRSASAYLDFPRFVQSDLVDDVLVLSIRRPQTLNALSDQVNDELLAALRGVEGKVAGAVILGAGEKAFSSGADVGRFPDMLGDQEGAAEYARSCSRLLRWLDAAPFPVVAAINGLCLGGGLELAMRCRELVALPTATLRFPEVMLGILPGTGGLVVPFRRWPAAVARLSDMVRFAAPLSGAAAHALGIVSELAEDVPDLVRCAVARVKAAAAAPSLDAPVSPGALDPTEAPRAGTQDLSPAVDAIVVDAIRAAAAAPSLEEALEIGYRAFGQVACTLAAAEGVGAFLGGRASDLRLRG